MSTLPPSLQKKVREFYVTIKSFPHFGEKAVPRKGRRVNEVGELEREFVLIDCQHGEHTVWLTRADIWKSQRPVSVLGVGWQQI